MTEPRVEAGDRALETVGKIMQDITEQAASQDIVVTFKEEGKWAALIQSAMNAQERELKSTLSRAMVNLHQASLAIAESERLLAERGGKQ